VVLAIHLQVGAVEVFAGLGINAAAEEEGGQVRRAIDEHPVIQSVVPTEGTSLSIVRKSAYGFDRGSAWLQAAGRKELERVTNP
jgi:hypothetical protein